MTIEPFAIIVAFVVGTIFGALVCDSMWRRSLTIVQRAAGGRRVDLEA